MVKPRFVEVEKQPASAQQAVAGYNTRVAIRTSKLQSESRFSSLEVALADITEALTVFKGVVAESKDRFSSAFREPEQGNGRGGRGNASSSGEKDVVQQPGLPELVAELARLAADSGGSAGGVDKAL